MLMMYTMMDIMFFKIMMYIKIMVYTLNMMYIMNMVYLLLLDSTRYTWCCTGLASLWVCMSATMMVVAGCCLTALGGRGWNIPEHERRHGAPATATRGRRTDGGDDSEEKGRVLCS